MLPRGPVIVCRFLPHGRCVGCGAVNVRVNEKTLTCFYCTGLIVAVEDLAVSILADYYNAAPMEVEKIYRSLETDCHSARKLIIAHVIGLHQDFNYRTKGHTERCFLRIGHQGPHLFVRCSDSFKPLYWECQTRKCVEEKS